MKQPIEIVVQNLKQGSDQAKEFIFLNYHSAFLKFAIRFVESREDAEDIISEVLFKIFNRIHQLQDPVQFYSWCCTLIKNDCYNFIKARKIDSDLDLYDPAIFQDFSKSFDLYLTIQAIDKLPPGYKSVVRLHCLEGYNTVEVGSILQIDPGTVRSQLFKARKILRQFVNNEY